MFRLTVTLKKKLTIKLILSIIIYETTTLQATYDGTSFIKNSNFSFGWKF